MTDEKTKLQELEEKIKILEQVADKARLSKHQPKGEKGQTVSISLYRESLSDEPRVVIGWEMIKDEVRVGRNGVEEEQTVRVTLEPSGSKDTRVQKMQLGSAKKSGDEKKIAELEKQIADAESDDTVEMSYKDFALRYLEKVVVDVKGTENINGEVRFIVDYKDKEYRLGAAFIN